VTTKSSRILLQVLNEMQKTIILAACCVLLLSGMNELIPDVVGDELDEDHALTLEFQTPHTDWAQPYSRRKTRVLFITDCEDLRPRECVELMQRFDIDGKAVFWGRIIDAANSGWHGGAAGAARAAKLLEERWECFVFLELGMQDMAEELQYKLLKQVADGAGIVFVGTDDKRVLKEKNRLTTLPPFLEAESIEAAFTVGKGHGVRTVQRPYIEYRFGWETEFDFWQEQLGRAVLWAAGKEAKSALTLTAARTDAGNVVRASLTGEVAARNPQLQVCVKREGEVRVSFPQQPINTSAPVDLKLPYLPAGTYYVVGRVLGSTGVETWGTTQFIVKSRRSVSDVELTKGWGEVGDAVKGTAKLTGKELPNERVTVRLLDRRGRVLAQQQSTPTQSQATFEFRIEPWMPMLLAVDAVLYADGREMSHAHSWFNITKRNRSQFNLMMWSAPSGTLAPYAEEQLAKTGVTVQLQGGEPPIIAAAYNISLIPYTMRVTPFKDSIPDESMKQYGLPFCWNDESAVADHAAKLAKSYQPARQHGVFAWSLGDETTTQGACLSEHCQKAYRVYLKEVYGTIDALNQSWSTSFKSWDEVGVSKANPHTTDEAYRNYFKSVTTHHNLAYLWFTDPSIKLDEMKFNKEFFEIEEGPAWLQKNYSRWYDRQAFKSWNFAQLCRKYGEAFKSIDPEARTGVEGAGRFGYNDDVDLIIRNTGFWGPYPDTLDEVIRSIASRDYPRFNWMGYQKDADPLLGHYWRMVTRGMDTVAWWTWYVLGAYRGWLAPDLRPFPAVQEIVKDTQIMRDGLGDLLIHSDMQDDGIAVLYSHPSAYASKLENGNSFGGYEQAHKATHELLRELGLQFRYVTDRMLRQGEFDTSRFKVLFLPRADALGDKEAAMIADFVRGGGTVIADVRPGVFGDRCKLRDSGVLDTLFGVKRKGLAAAKSARATVGNSEFSGDGTLVDAEVETTDGKAMGEAGGSPVLISRALGQGRAILLNASMNSLPSLRQADTPQAVEGFILSHLDRAGVTPAVSLKNANGQRLRHIEAIRWKDGDIEILALFRQGGANEEAEVSLPRASYVYDLRNRKSLGKTDRFKTTILANRASFFALCPQAAPPPKLVLGSARVSRGDLATVAISVPGAKGLHAFKVQASQGNQKVDWHDQVVLAGEKPVEIVLPIAYNDPAGAYQVGVVDLFTGEATKATLEVRLRCRR